MSEVRKLTLEIEITQPDANWIWEEHISGKMHRGMYIRTIADGHLITDPPSEKEA